MKFDQKIKENIGEDALEIWEKIEKDKLTVLDILTIFFKRRILISAFAIIPVLIVIIYFSFLPSSYQGEALLGFVKTDRPVVDVPETKKLVEISINKWKNGEPPRGFDIDLAKKIENVYVYEIPAALSQIKITIRAKGEVSDLQKIFDGLKMKMGLSDYAVTRIDFYSNKYLTQIKELQVMLKEAIETKQKTWLLMNQTQNISVDPLSLDASINDLKMKILKEQSSLLELQNYHYDSGPHITPYSTDTKMRLFIVIFGIIGFLTGLFIALFLEIKTSLKQI